MGKWNPPEHPYPAGTIVRHYGHQWPAAWRGTATVRTAVPNGRYWEYVVDPIPERWRKAEEYRELCGGGDFQWSDTATVPVDPAINERWESL